MKELPSLCDTNKLIEYVKDEIYSKYGTFLLNRKQTAEITNRSLKTIDRWRSNGRGPIFRKDEFEGSPKNSAVQYSIYNLAEFIVTNNTKTA